MADVDDHNRRSYAPKANRASSEAKRGRTNVSRDSAAPARAGVHPENPSIPGAWMLLPQFLPGAQPVYLHKQPTPDHAGHVDHQGRRVPDVAQVQSVQGLFSRVTQGGEVELP